MGDLALNLPALLVIVAAIAITAWLTKDIDDE